MQNILFFIGFVCCFIGRCFVPTKLDLSITSIYKDFAHIYIGMLLMMTITEHRSISLERHHYGHSPYCGHSSSRANMYLYGFIYLTLLEVVLVIYNYV